MAIENGEICAALSKVMAEIGSIGKNSENSFDHYKFRGIDDVYNAVQPAFVKHGVFVVPEVIEQTHEQKLSSNDKPMMWVILRIRYRFYAPDGSYVDAVTVGEAMDRGDKSCNKAMSAAFKYALFQVLCIPTEGDNDADASSPELGAEKAKTSATKPAASGSTSAPSGSAPNCPECGAEMKLRTVKKDGKNKNREFYGCPQKTDAGEWCEGFIWADELEAEAELPAFPDGWSSDTVLPTGYKYSGDALGEVPSGYLARMAEKGRGKQSKIARAELASREQMGVVVADYEPGHKGDEPLVYDDIPF